MLRNENQICTVQYHPQTCDERLITSEGGWVYKKKKRIGPRTEPCGTPQVRSEREDLTSFTVTTCVLERQSKITDTESVLAASQKNAMSIVSKAVLRSRKVRMEIEPESEAVRRSLKTRGELSQYCVLGDKLTGWQRCWSRKLFSVSLDTKDRFCLLYTSDAADES